MSKLTKAQKKVIKKARTQAKLNGTFKAPTATKLPGRGSKVIYQQGNEKIEMLRGLGLNQFSELAGDVPARTELLEASMIRLLNESFGDDLEDWDTLGTWKDVIIRHTIGKRVKIIPIREPRESREITMIYGRKVTLTPMEYGLAMFAMANSVANSIIAGQVAKGEGHNLQIAAFWFISGEESGENYHNTLAVADKLKMHNVFSVIN